MQGERVLGTTDRERPKEKGKEKVKNICLMSSRHMEGIKRITRRRKRLRKVKGGRKIKKPDFYAISFSRKYFLEIVKR